MVELSKQRLENVQGGGLINPLRKDGKEGDIETLNGVDYEWHNGEWVPIRKHEYTNNINQ